MLTLLVFLACSTKTDDTSTDTDTSVDTSTDTSTDTSGDTDTGGACSTVNSGEDWAWTGECPQMTTPCEIVVKGCSMTIAYSSGMDMGMPYAATIAGETVTFENGQGVRGCTGTVVSADKIEGECNGCTYTLER